MLATVPYMEQTFGAWHLGGGVATLAGALARRCEERGVVLRYGTDVTRIEVGHGRASGVRLADGEILPADIVVANADASHVYNDLLDDPRAAKVAKDLARSTPALSGFVLLLALDGRTPGLHHHNVWFPADYDGEFDAIFGRRPQPPEDPAIYVCAPDDPAMRPDDDSEAWFVLVNTPRHGDGSLGTVDWAAPGFAEGYADHLLATLAARGTDVRDRIRWREIRSPADLRAQHAGAGRLDLRHVEQWRTRGLPAAGEPVAGPRPVPGGRLGPPRWRTATGGHGRRDRGRPDRPRLTPTPHHQGHPCRVASCGGFDCGRGRHNSPLDRGGGLVRTPGSG